MSELQTAGPSSVLADGAQDPIASRTEVPAAAELEARQELIRKYRVKMSPHLAGLVKRSDAVARQFIPDQRESEKFGTETPFEEGKLNNGIYGLERVYADRAVLTPHFDCAAYCRYCFKKTRTLAGEGRQMNDADIAAAVEYIKNDPRIKTVLITGGDPLERPDLLEKILDQVAPIPHVTNYRIGTRNILFKPEAVTDAFADMLARYNRIDYDNLEQSKNIAVGLSLNHPDELSPQVARSVERLVKRGVVVRGQSVLLKDVNDDARTLHRLFSLFGAIGMVPYYFLHCMPAIGTRHMRTTVQKGLDLLAELSPLTGAIAPLYIYVTEAGKHRLMPGMPLEYVTIDGLRYIRAKTRYKAADWLKFSDKKSLPPRHEVSPDGYIVSHYLDGEDS